MAAFRGAGAIEMRPVELLKGYARNARQHSAKQIAKIAESIRAFGFNAPILVDADGVIIAGHGRLEGAKKAGLKEVPVVELGHLTDLERRAYILADNRLALEATWDEDLLAGELADLAALADGLNLDLKLTGFEVPEIDKLLGHADGLQQGADENPGDAPAPAPPAVPVAEPGDIWCLGRHRVACGDSTSAAAVAALLAGVEPHLMVTDPPYGVEYDPAWRNKAKGLGNRPGTGALGKVLNDDVADWRAAWELFPGDACYVWHGGLHAGTVAESLLAARFQLRAQIVWDKTRLVIGRGDYHWQHEPCWYAVRKGSKGHYVGDRKQTTVWAIQHLRSETGHGTQKPVECMARPIRNNSSPGQAIYDPFLGSGTTVIAAEQERRVCYGLELNPAYVDVIVLRWQVLTGLEATLAGDGRSFAAVAAQRPRKAA